MACCTMMKEDRIMNGGGVGTFFIYFPNVRDKSETSTTGPLKGHMSLDKAYNTTRAMYTSPEGAWINT